MANQSALPARVGIIMGSKSDWETMKNVADTLDKLGVGYEKRVLSAHRGTSAQLSYAGRRLNLLPNGSLNPEHQAMLSALSATSDFDNTYRAQQRIVVDQGVRLHAGYARSGDSPTLRPIAENAENVMRANLQALRGVR